MADGKCVIIGEVLKKYFKERHMTQQAIADVLGVSQGAVTALLNGKPFGSKTAQAWSDNFGFNITWLLTGDGEMLKNSALKSDAREKEINEFVHVPMVPVRAKAGYLIGYGDQEYVDTLPTIPVITDRTFHGKYRCFEVEGDSMDDGSILHVDPVPHLAREALPLVGIGHHLAAAGIVVLFDRSS